MRHFPLNGPLKTAKILRIFFITFLLLVFLGGTKALAESSNSDVSNETTTEISSEDIAEDTSNESVNPSSAADKDGEDVFTVLEAQELEDLLQRFIDDNKLNGDNISVGFYYTGTGEFWYFNEMEYYYSASLYKVPMMMCVTDKIRSGEIDWDYAIYKAKLDFLAENILVYSNNDYAQLVFSYFWPNNRECRELWPSLAGMEADELESDFYDYSYFNAYFMTRLFKTVYDNPEYYTELIDYLKRAQDNDYFKTYIGKDYTIAQKYGSFEQYKHVCGIIYTKNPIIVSFLTINTPEQRRLAGELARRLTEYTETVLDVRLDNHEAELRRIEEERLAEEQRLAEEARLAEEERLAEEARLAEEERLAEEARLAEVDSKTGTDNNTDVTGATSGFSSRPDNMRLLLCILCSVILLLLIIIKIATVQRRKH